MKKITSLVKASPILLTLLMSCGKNSDGVSDAVDILNSNIIVGEVDWKEITDLYYYDPIRQAAKPVGDINIPAVGSRCTGFLISDDVVMTNQHCFPDSRYAKGATVSFKHEAGASPYTQSKAKYKCETLLGNNQDLDYALLKCEGEPGKKFGKVELDGDTQLELEDELYVVQQNCDYYLERGCDWTKKYSLGKVVRVWDEISHNADTLGGSSGSPVFLRSSNKVVALHHAGYGNYGYGRGMENFAVPMNKIVEDVKANYPEIALVGHTSSRSPSTPGSGSSKPSKDDNTADKATVVEETFSVSDEIEEAYDKDFYKIEVTKLSKKTITLKYKNYKGDLDLYLFDKDGKMIAKSVSSSSTDKISKYLYKGEYYILVQGYKRAKGSYSLSAQ